MDAPPLIALTGAGGFLGRRLVHALRQKGLRVRALLRAGTSAPGAGEVVLGDLLDEAALAALVRGADVVLHAAAVMGSPRHGEPWRTNVDGTRTLLRAAAAASVGSFVHISSVAALSPSRGPYSRSRAEGEAVVRGGALPFRILRPAVLLGPGSQFEGAMRPLGSLPRVPVPAGRGLIRPVAARDAAEAIVAAVMGKGEPGGSWDLVGNEGLAFPRLAAEQLGVLGRPRQVWPTPALPWELAARGMTRFWPGGPLSTESLRALLEGTPGDGRAASLDLGFRPRGWGLAMREG